MVKRGVSMTSTLAVYEPFVANRPTQDARTLEAMTPALRETYLRSGTRSTRAAPDPVPETALKNAMAFERAFVAAGGLLASGVDPTGIGGALAGYGDQRNYELFIEAGFTPGAGGQDHDRQRREDPRRGQASGHGRDRASWRTSWC